jgi:hypothetical protein
MAVVLGAIVMTMPRVRGAAPSKPQKQTSPAAPKATAGPAITPVNVVIKPTCGHKVTPMAATLHARRKDRLRWLVVNNCGQDQPVLLCVYDANTLTLKNPFTRCSPDPNVHDIGKPFISAAHGPPTQFECAVEDENLKGKYKKQVRVGTDEVPSTGCPQIFQAKATKTADTFTIFMHALDIDVVP